MKIITLDFETYYDREYTLGKMTTEEYINDPRFEVIMCGLRDIEGEYHIIDPVRDDIRDKLRWFGADTYPVLAHNMYFDGAILAWRYNIIPSLYLDTMCMANARIKAETGSSSLKAMAEYLHLPAKGTEVQNMLGRNRHSLSDEEFAAYADYCRNDVMITHNAFTLLTHKFPSMQLLIIDRVIRMFTQPKLRVNAEECMQAYTAAERELTRICAELGVDISTLMSNTKFAALLEQLTGNVPTKISMTTGKTTMALSKKDPEMKRLAAHPNPAISRLIKARTMAKSTQERTRFLSFAQIAQRTGGLLPVPVRYYGAHTGRLAGMDNINLQNLRRGSDLRRALKAPKDHYIVAPDQAQIEARLNACWAGQEDLVEDFRLNRDVYSKFASMVYGKTITKENNPDERFVGKTCILGLGYSMGVDKLQATLEQADVYQSREFCGTCVATYRSAMRAIADNWRRGDEMIESMLYAGGEQWGPIITRNESLELPNGMFLYYPNLTPNREVRGYTYQDKSRYSKTSTLIHLYGGKLVENCVQAMAADIIMEQLVKLSMVYSVVLQVHDEIVLLVPKSEINEAVDLITKIMTKPPVWMPNLPLAVEIKYGETYGDCK